MLDSKYQRFYDEIVKKIKKEKIFTDKLHTLAYGTDASFYRLIPKIVIKTDNAKEVQDIIELSNSMNLSITYRAGGTSLSGQAICDSILVITSRNFSNFKISPDASYISLQPALTGAQANGLLARYSKKIGPDPASINAAMIGGIAANNASGMCCGISQNSYKTLKSMKLIFADGTKLDTGCQESKDAFRKSHGDFLNDLKSFSQDESLVALRWSEYQKYLVKVDYIKTVKEEKYQDGFLKDVFENCLGYTLDMTNPLDFNLEREKKNETDGKKADGVIYVDGKIVGVIELKAQDTKNLDKIEAQAFNYHASHSNSKYIIISNFDELRFYIDKKTAYEKFSLFNLDYEEFKKLHLLISFESIKNDIPLKLKEKTSNFEQNISKELYKDFSVFRNSLFEKIVNKKSDIEKSKL